VYFEFGAKIVRVIDGDSAIVDSYVTKQDEVTRIRFKDRFSAELDDPDATQRDIAAAEKKAAEEMFPVGCEVKLTNTRAHWTYDRLEARVDRT
jgi:hypothetical protein